MIRGIIFALIWRICSIPFPIILSPVPRYVTTVEGVVNASPVKELRR